MMAKMYLMGDERRRDYALPVADGFLQWPLDQDTLKEFFSREDCTGKVFLIISSGSKISGLKRRFNKAAIDHNAACCLYLGPKQAFCTYRDTNPDVVVCEIDLPMYGRTYNGSHLLEVLRYIDAQGAAK